jgi:hypothetical protein
MMMAPPRARQVHRVADRLLGDLLGQRLRATAPADGLVANVSLRSGPALGGRWSALRGYWL